MQLESVFDEDNEGSNIDLEAAAAAIIILQRHNIPPDTIELLIHGNPRLGVPPKALLESIRAIFKVLRKHEVL